MTNPFEIIEARLSIIEALLIDLKHSPKKQAAPADDDELLTIQEAAKFLNLSVATLYGYSSRLEVPFCKRSKRLYFSKKSLLAWIKEGKRKTAAEIASEADQYLAKKGGTVRKH